ncbi:glycosyltransferase family 39 protein [Maioricimonas rarisocia]|nr:glycosyltransferase family 39 protein [Maioricimonas rarisocia]
MHWRDSLIAPPAVTGDSPDYDSIGWEVARGRGFVRNFADADFRRPYLDRDAQTRFPGGDEPVAHPATDRPPLYPLLLAGLNRTFGRQFWSIRLAQCVMMGIAAAFAASIAYRSAGPAPAMLTAFGFVLVDWRTRWSTREVLTESLACLTVTLLIVALVVLLRRPSTSRGVLCGIAWSLAILTRTMFVLWGPVLLLLLLATPQRRQCRKIHQAAAALIVTTLLLCSPWWIRNCIVLDSFMPLGTQGREQLSAAYSDEAFRRAGMWFNLDHAGFFDALDLPNGDPMKAARLRAAYSGACAREWMAAHPVKTLMLVPMRIIQEFRPHGPGELAILVFALLGIVVLFARVEGQVIAALLLAQALTVGLTWSVSGRFLIPLLGGLHAAAGVGLWAAFVLLVERRHAARRLLMVTEPASPVHPSSIPQAGAAAALPEELRMKPAQSDVESPAEQR